MNTTASKQVSKNHISVTNLRIHFLKGFWFINQGTIDSSLVFELKRKEVIIKRYNIGTSNQSIYMYTARVGRRIHFDSLSVQAD